jgi:hypothetical protein
MGTILFLQHISSICVQECTKYPPCHLVTTLYFENSKLNVISQKKAKKFFNERKLMVHTCLRQILDLDDFIVPTIVFCDD